MDTNQALLTKILATTDEVANTIAALQSSKVYGGTDPHTGLRLRVIVVRPEGAVFSELIAENDNGDDLELSDFYVGDPAPTAAAGDYLRPPANYYFTTFTLTSGSVQGA